MDKFAIYATAANFKGKILFLMQIYHSASGGLHPQTPYRGFAPGSHWGTIPQTPLQLACPVI